MKKTSVLLVMILMVLSATAQASALTGNWCETAGRYSTSLKYDDFIAVLKIAATGDLVTYSQGIESQEIVVSGKGFISQGASSMQMVLDGVDQNVVDAEVTSLLGKKRLTLVKADGSEIFYKECKAK